MTIDEQTEPFQRKWPQNTKIKEKNLGGNKKKVGPYNQNSI